MKTGDDYFDSEEFRELLRNYEESVSSGQPIFLDADELTDIADYYHYTGALEPADDAISQALALNPGATSPLVYRIREELGQENVEEAKELLDQITDKSDPDYFYMKAEILIAQNKVEEADRFLRDYLLNVPDDELGDFVLDVANIWLDYGVNDKAYEWMMRSPGNDSDDFKELMGHIMFGLGKFKDSQRIFNELLDHDPYSTRYWNALASAQFMNEDFGDSVTSSEFAIAIDPDDSEGILTKANALFRLNNFDEALKYYERYHQLMPPLDFTELQMALCYMYKNNVDEAIAHLEKARQLTSNDSPYQMQVYQELAFCFSAKGLLDKALECIDQTQDLDCDHSDMEVLRGHILLENQRIGEAANAFGHALAMSDYAPHVLLRIIVSLYDNKFISAAYTMLKKFFKYVGSDCNDGYSYMALCCWDLKKNDEFLHYLQAAVERNPTEAHTVLQNIFPEGMDPKDYYEYIKNRIQQ